MCVTKEVKMLSDPSVLGLHDNIVECFGVWDDKDYIHLVLEYCEVSLRQWIIMRYRAKELKVLENQLFTESQAKKIIREVATGIQHLY